jgi:MinD-like ATPase involved in chromosome partitioning or flagellar assembly
MSTPPNAAPNNEPSHEQPLPEQRDVPAAAPQADQRRPPDAADNGSGRGVRWPTPPPPQAGPAPADERRRSAAPPPAGPAPQPSVGSQHARSAQRPQFSWPDPPPRPNNAPREPAADRPGPAEETEDRTLVLPPTEFAGVRNQHDDDQGFGDFFTDAPPAEDSPQSNRAPAQSPGSASGPQQAVFGGLTGAPDGFVAGGRGASVKRQQIVTSRRRRAARGWRRLVSKVTFGLINPRPSAKQEQAEELIRRIRAALVDVYVVAFVSAKGGVGKTTMTVAAGSAIARERGDRVIAVDADTDLGNLSSRFEQQGGPKANIEALSSLQDPSSYSTVRVFTVQNDDRLEMLAAQNDPGSPYTLNSQDFETTMKILRLHYNVILLDCGTAITSPLFSTIAKHVDSLVMVASEDAPGLNGAWATLTWLHAHGFSRLLPRTVVAINATFEGKPLVDIDEAERGIREEIEGVSVVRVPYDVHLAEGGDISFAELKPRTRKALMDLAGAVAQHYPARQPHRYRTDETGRF